MVDLGMTHDEHLAWAKARALEYLEAGDIRNALASMAIDLDNHEAFKYMAPQIAAAYATGKMPPLLPFYGEEQR